MVTSNNFGFLAGSNGSKELSQGLGRNGNIIHNISWISRLFFLLLYFSNY